MSKIYMINSLLAAGFSVPHADQAALINATITNVDDPNAAKLFQQYRQDHLFTLAQHRSHSSHSSHRSGTSGHYSHSSHTSHASSTGGYSAPAPAPLYTPPSSPSRSSSSGTPSSSGSADTGTSSYESPYSAYGNEGDGNSGSSAGVTKQRVLSGRTSLFKTIVMHVQVALMGYGLFDGPIDGQVGLKTRNALRQFQAKHNLKETGTITNETLDALHVPTQSFGE